MIDKLKTLPQYLIPQHGLSRLMGWLAHIQKPAWLKDWAIKAFIAHYGVNMTEAAEPDYTQYSCFNKFFTRALKPGIRPIDPDGVISPADGVISEMGEIKQDKLIQAKNHDYSLLELLGGNAEYASWFQNGVFSTIYLSPKDYHRVHMPYQGHLLKKIYIPGKLFSVNMRTARTVPNLFARNERVVTLFETPIGKMAVIFVGAMIVGNIVILPQENSFLEKGDELGYFQLGSTVIVLFEANKVILNSHTSLKMGQALCNLLETEKP